MKPPRSDEIVELRQYALVPGGRTRLIDLFEERFIEAQEESGVTVLGTFRDRSDPDRFVWLRSFPTIEARARSLDAFYYGQIWQANRDVANATMIDSDDVLLLEWEGQPLPVPDLSTRPPQGSTIQSPARAHLQVFFVDDRASSRLPMIAEGLAPRLEVAFGVPVFTLRTSNQPNNFPQLPVRPVHTLVCIAILPDEAALQSSQERAAIMMDELRNDLGHHLVDEQDLELEPTPRSLIR